MVSKILVANRGEIAIRAFRAAYELGVATVAVFPYEDRNSEHRLKADEAYQIGEPGHPVRAYLDPGLIVEAAREGRRRRHLSRLRLPVGEPGARRGLRGTRASRSSARTPSVLALAGNKARAIAAARAAGVPTLRSVAPGTDVDALVREAPTDRLPRLREGGGRRRRPRHAPGRGAGRRCAEAIETCMREAEAAFGDPTVFLEQAVIDPRHIEVQILADAQRRRDPPVRARLLGAAPPPEGRRDRARAEPRPGPARADLRRRGAVRAPRSATSTRARSSSWSTRRATTSSSR